MTEARSFQAIESFHLVPGVKRMMRNPMLQIKSAISILPHIVGEEGDSDCAPTCAPSPRDRTLLAIKLFNHSAPDYLLPRTGID